MLQSSYACDELRVPPLEVDPAFELAEADSTRPVSCAIETIASSELPTPRLSITDFSNHLNLTFDAGKFEGGHPTCLSPEGYQGLPGEDPYGWEAELERKDHHSGDSYFPTFHYRRAGGAKRSLLHRVFSLGPRETM